MFTYDCHGKFRGFILFAKKIGSSCSIFFVTAFVFLLFLFVATFAIRTVQYVHVIYIDATKPSPSRTSQKYLSIALDSSVIAEGFNNFNVTDPKLIRMLKHLHPAFLRIGGTLADKLHFSEDSDRYDREVEKFYRSFNFYQKYMDYNFVPNFTMTGTQWLNLVELANQANLDIIFGLNALIRFENGSWDYRNAESLIKFSNDHSLRVNWELGNEPNSFRHKFNETVNATQMARDFAVLRSILRKYPMYEGCYLVGPDTTRPVESHKESEIYLRDFVENAKSINAVTWHQYYMNGRTAEPQNFLDPEVMDLLENEIKTVKDIVDLTLRITPIWLGETSSAYGGGAPGLSNTFIGVFLWVDKLGVAAKMGLKVVIRQSIFKGNYALLDKEYNPNPDWWISVLYKKLVGIKVVPYYTACSSRVRIYCHCARRSLFGGFTQGITVFGINLNNSTANVRIEGLFPQELERELFTTIFAYELTADESLFAPGIRLNGKVLKMTPNNDLPALVPKIMNPAPFVSMPPYSVVFWVIPDTNVLACRTSLFNVFDKILR